MSSTHLTPTHHWSSFSSQRLQGYFVIYFVITSDHVRLWSDSGRNSDRYTPDTTKTSPTVLETENYPQKNQIKPTSADPSSLINLNSMLKTKTMTLTNPSAHSHIIKYHWMNQLKVFFWLWRPTCLRISFHLAKFQSVCHDHAQLDSSEGLPTALGNAGATVCTTGLGQSHMWLKTSVKDLENMRFIQIYTVPSTWIQCLSKLPHTTSTYPTADSWFPHECLVHCGTFLVLPSRHSLPPTSVAKVSQQQHDITTAW